MTFTIAHYKIQKKRIDRNNEAKQKAKTLSAHNKTKMP